MEKYEPLGVVGEGSYGIVLKCKNRSDGNIVAIKKFIDSEDDLNVRKIALREIRVLKKLRHENLVNLIEVFRRRKHLYLVFEFIDHTLLDQLEETSHGLDEETCRKYIFQVLRGLGFCHDNSVIHRDVKPENVLVSKSGIVKLCDFGFARNLCGPGDAYTDYVATRWYRAPELLVGDVAYGKEVDIWAVGCLFAEMMTGEALFPGDSDIDQLFLIAQCLGRLSKRHLSLMSKNSAFRGFQLPPLKSARTGSNTSTNSIKFTSLESTVNKNPNQNSSMVNTYSSNMMGNSGSGATGAGVGSGLRKRSTTKSHRSSGGGRSGHRNVFSVLFPSWSEEAVNFLTVCLDPEPQARPTCNVLMNMPYFTNDGFSSRFLNELNNLLIQEGKPPITTHTVRKRRSLVTPTTLRGPSAQGPFQAPLPVRPQMIQKNGTVFIQTQNNSRTNSLTDESLTPTATNAPTTFQSSNFVNGNGGKGPAFLKNKKVYVADQNQSSKIPILLQRKGEEDKRFSVSQQNQQQPQAPQKKFSFSSENQFGYPPITTLTFNLTHHAHSPSQNNGAGGVRSSPGRQRKKFQPQPQVSSYFNTTNNNKSLPAGVSIYGSSMMLKNESFLPRMKVSFDENQGSGPGPSGHGHGPPGPLKLHNRQPLSLGQMQSRRGSTDFGNIKPFQSINGNQSPTKNLPIFLS